MECLEWKSTQEDQIENPNKHQEVGQLLCRIALHRPICGEQDGEVSAQFFNWHKNEPSRENRAGTETEEDAGNPDLVQLCTPT